MADEAADTSKREFAAGSTSYKLGHFDEALLSYERAYRAKPLPELLFNIGQCHFNLKRYDKAIFFYESYLREKPDAANRELVEQQIADSKALRKKVLDVAREEPKPEPAQEQDIPPWVIIAGAATVTLVVVIVAGAAVVLVTSRPAPSPKSGSLNTIDARTE